MSAHSGATAVRFHTKPLSEKDANILHEQLGTVVAAHDVWLGGDDGAGWVGSIAPVDTTEAGLLALIDRLRVDSRIEPLTVAVGNFP